MIDVVSVLLAIAAIAYAVYRDQMREKEVAAAELRASLRLEAQRKETLVEMASINSYYRDLANERVRRAVEAEEPARPVTPVVARLNLDERPEIVNSMLDEFIRNQERFVPKAGGETARGAPPIPTEHDAELSQFDAGHGPYKG